MMGRLFTNMTRRARVKKKMMAGGEDRRASERWPGGSLEAGALVRDALPRIAEVVRRTGGGLRAGLPAERLVLPGDHALRPGQTLGRIRIAVRAERPRA